MNNTRYYLSANGCNGYVSFWNEATADFDKNIILKNLSNKKELFKKCIPYLNDKKYDIVLAPNYSDEIDGLIFPDDKISIACEECYENIPPSNSIIFDFNEATNQSPKTDMFAHMNRAKKIHDEWEKLYIDNIDFITLDNAAEDLISIIFTDSIPCENKGKNIDRFFGTMLTDGNRNLIDELTLGLKSRIFIKGRPGTGKSTLLKRIRKKAMESGYDTETYYCSFDTKSLDMVIIRALNICIFDSTAPHEMFPEFESDSIFDVYDIAVYPDTDEKFDSELADIKARYNAEMNSAKECLKNIQSFSAPAANPELFENNLIEILKLI